MSRPRKTGEPGAVVIGSDYKCLGVVRSLGRQGIRVWVLRDDHALATWSRYAERSLPWPASGEGEQVSYLLTLARRYALGGWALFPGDDETAALLARNSDRLGETYRVSVLTPWARLRSAYDKRLTYRLAAEVGVDHPRTRYPGGREDVLAYDGGFPAILKPATRAEPNRFTTAKAWPADDLATLVARYDEACTLVERSLVMIQEVIPGDGRDQLSYAALCDDGEPVVSLVARRLRQWPADFGRASTYVETIDDPEVEATAGRLLAALHFDGLVEVEFKRDRRDGRLKLLDVNPRIWGWHTLGRRAGVDFPYLLWRMLNGAPVSPARGRPGVRWVRALTDVPTVLGALRAGELSFPAYLSSLRGPIEYAVLARDDPLPAIVELPSALHLAWVRRRRTEASVSPAVVSPSEARSR